MPTARTTDPDTSVEAAASIDEDQLRRSQLAVLKTLRHLVAATDAELVSSYLHRADAGLAHYQSQSGIRTRRNELVKAGLIVDTGVRAWSGRRHHIVWAAADLARPSR